MGKKIFVCQAFFLFLFCGSALAAGNSFVQFGDEVYELRQDRVYLLTAHRTAFTTATSPFADAEVLEGLSDDFRDRVVKAGHMGFVYFNDSGLWVSSQSEWQGVFEKPVDDWNIAEYGISGLYEIVGADKTKVMASVGRAVSSDSGWFLVNVDSPFGVGFVNRVLGKKHGAYLGCAGMVTKIASDIDVDVLSNIEYVPMRGCEDRARIVDYVLDYGISKKKSELYASALCSIASMVEGYKGFVSFLGLKASVEFATPPEIILGNLKAGVLVPVEPVN